MKNKLALTLLASLISSTAFAHVQGHRVGIGFSSMEADNHSYGDGLLLEYGYDFNQIFGLHFVYERNSDISVGSWKGDGDTFKFGADIGYAFEVEGAAIKPFFRLGFFSYDESGFGCQWNGCWSTKYSDSGVYTGLGVRGMIGPGYVEIGKDFFDIDNIDADHFHIKFGMNF
ncbi:outer membrane beta-barrel protein [Thaumasiovibrio subtropicus]|uniref:outer membrane beta-barrel protein n=1 Tax=Thaumasiovibrio subtropicus TaxID=1891207 RepID=UPI00131EB294|nr:outer membrane beta-barrel protein [Thaumasiovibrio subtropicus]